MTLLPSRRTLLIAGASATTCAMLTGRAAAQLAPPPAEDGFKLLRATPSGYDGSIPGPLLRVRQGDDLKIRLSNERPQATTIHWHGVRVPNRMDGVPELTQPLIEPRESFDYRFKTIDAGTFWYRTGTEPAARGLYGPLIVDEKTPPEIDRDIVLIFDERLVPASDIPAKTHERLRLRFINAAKARLLQLRIDRHTVRVMAVDGQPAQPFLARDSRFTLGPGNRIDLFLDALLEPGETASVFVEDSGSEKEAARIVYDRGEKRRASPLPDPKPLPANPLPERIDMKNALRVEAPLDAATSPTWIAAGTLGGFGAPLFSVKRGRAVVMAFPNRTDFACAAHPHGHHVRLLDNFDDGWKPFWLDTILIEARQTMRIAFVADNPGKWLIDCQRIGPDDAAMTAWFEVT
jgi:FtsP/CotA-like multicopper oxidase with cupredoxin domain